MMDAEKAFKTCNMSKMFFLQPRVLETSCLFIEILYFSCPTHIIINK